MSDPAHDVVDLIFGRWRSQILYAGAALGVFDHLTLDNDAPAQGIADAVGADPVLLYRLLRALATIGLLTENEAKAFRLTAAGALLRADHPQSLRAMALFEEGPEAYAIWKHLVAIVLDGGQNGFLREFGATVWEHARANPDYRARFNEAMTSYSMIQTEWVRAALGGLDLSAIRTLCDIGGGHGHLACGLLRAYPHLTAVVFDLPDVVAETDQLWAPKLGMTDRCRYVGGDMFQLVPSADAYVLKMILHDWNDEECVDILSNIRRASPATGQLFIAEFVVPGPTEPHFAKLFDIHMMCGNSGRERTPSEYANLLAAAGWRYTGTRHPSEGLMSVVVGVPA
jgi:hypothetical protein